jgi:hypothetical protein
MNMASMRSSALSKVCWLTISVLAISNFPFPARAHADGGQLRCTIEGDTVQASVFTDPTPVHLGTVDFNMIVQPVNGGSLPPLPGCQVEVYRDGSPDKRQRAPAFLMRAFNTPTRVAQMELNEPGLWHVEVALEDVGDPPVKGRFDLNVEDSYSTNTISIAWAGLPVIAIWLYVVHRRRVRRRIAPEPTPGT